MSKQIYNCPNCAAPIGYSRKCAYCGTEFDETPSAIKQAGNGTLEAFADALIRLSRDSGINRADYHGNDEDGDKNVYRSTE